MYVFTFVKNPNGVIKSHGLNIERCKNSLFICQSWVIIGRNLERGWIILTIITLTI